MINWLTPEPDQYITDIAAHFIWKAVKGAESYTLEYGADVEFKDCVRIQVEQIAGCEVAFLLAPEDKLPKVGTVYARVKANTGESSETLRFSCDTEHTKAPLRRKISPESPYFTIFDYGEHEWGRVYEMLPDTLKPYTALLPIGRKVSFVKRQDTFIEMDKQGYPWHLMPGGAMTVFQGHLAILPLSTIEYLLQNTKNLSSVGLLEQYQGTKPDGDDRIDYFKRLIILCGKYGVPFFYSDGNRNSLEMASFVKRPIYMDFLREYRDYVTLSYKQNHANASYTCYGAILGAWMDNTCAHIGVQGENWYWNDAGFRDDPGGYYGYLQGNEQQIPACMSSQMLLTGLSIGACYYSMEGPSWLIQARGNDDLEWSPQGLAAISLMQCIIQNKLIPSKDEVVDKIKAVVSADGICGDLGDAWVGGKYRKVFQNIYGIDHGFELFLKQSRYYYLPLMTSNEDRFKNLKIIHADNINDPDEVNRILDPLYERQYAGNAYITEAGNTFVIMNSNENKQQSQFFALEPRFIGAENPIVSKIEGSLSLWQYILMWQRAGVLNLHMNAPFGTSMAIRLYMQEKPETDFCGDGLVVWWNSQESYLKVTLTGNDQPVDLLCTAAMGTLKKRAYEPIRNKSDTAVYLSDLPFSKVSCEGEWLPAKDRCANGACGKLPIVMNGLRYPHGFSFMRNTFINFDLARRYRHLEFTAGFDSDAWMPIIIDREHIVWDRIPKNIDLLFTLSGDGRELYKSTALTRSDWREIISVDVSGISGLTFSLTGNVIPDEYVMAAVTGTSLHVPFPRKEVVAGDSGVEVYMDIGNPVLFS
ncbi:MAG: NPCBM/NEW2 domain-containing protein [Treponema sp.]|jgi:hypothetical protein|nr:NPCBM/NEW2 domain-containing protein [Treponema sp.]